MNVIVWEQEELKLSAVAILTRGGVDGVNKMSGVDSSFLEIYLIFQNGLSS